MKHLHISPTITAQWQTLISDAQKNLSISLGEELESYLVFLLIRFTQSAEIGSEPIATEWLGSLKQFGQKRQQSLRDVGDKCLIYSGLFPGIARKRLVPISYYVNIGRSAYLTLAEEYASNLSVLFLQLHESFVPLMDVLHSTREIDNKTHFTLDLLQAEELWHQTGSTHAKQALENLLSRNIADLHTPPQSTQH